MRKSVPTPVGLSDGTIVAMQRMDEQLVVHITAWNNTELEVRFCGVIGMRETLAGDISDLVVQEGSGDFWNWCIEHAYERVPARCREKLYQFLDHDDKASLEVVGIGVEVTERESSAGKRPPTEART